MWTESYAAACEPPDIDNEYSRFMGPMESYPLLAYSMKAVRRAGEQLGEDIVVDRNTTEDEYRRAIETFAIANSWRDSHLLPMRSIRFSVSHHMRKLRERGLRGDMASRPKRMASIRRKLRETTTNLDTMNDIGGCRAIMEDIRGVRELLAAIRAKFPHDIHPREYNYIDQPKPDGYRSHHLVLQYRPKDNGTEPYAGRRIELQIRTRLQHAWATAVEAVGLFRGQDLKHGKGDADWLRLFELMAAEFCHVEECPVLPNVPARSDRLRELKDLNLRIGAISILENIRNVTRYATDFVHLGERSRHYLLTYSKDHSVRVEPFWTITPGAESLHKIEQQIELGADDDKVVLVEVDRVEKLVSMYPNYFGDVSLFISNCKALCLGRDAVEYSMAPQKVVKPRPNEQPDYSWLRRKYTRWTDDRRR